MQRSQKMQCVYSKVWILLVLLPCSCLAMRLADSHDDRNHSQQFGGGELLFAPHYPQSGSCESLMNEIQLPGVYYLDQRFLKVMGWVWGEFKMYCDYSDGVGWTVIQRRGGAHGTTNTPVNFARSWNDYARGFGNLNGEFWFGNEWLKRLTSSFGPYELKIIFEDWDGQTAWVKYSDFKIMSKEDSYRIVVSGYTGNAGDCFGNENPIFTTYDHLGSSGRTREAACASLYRGGWWYERTCHKANLNGDYYWHDNHSRRDPHSGLIWHCWRPNYSLKSTKMMIRSKLYRKFDCDEYECDGADCCATSSTQFW